MSGILDHKGSIPAYILFIGINVLVSIIAFIFMYAKPESISWFALQPDNIFNGIALWTLVTHFFVHGSIFHLLINMFVLFSLGGLTERIIGKKRFVWLYLVAGLVAGLLSVILAGLFGS